MLRISMTKEELNLKYGLAGKFQAEQDVYNHVNSSTIFVNFQNVVGLHRN
jgi:hypothetical protein